MWALLVFMALGLFALVMIFVMSLVDEKIKAGNFHIAVLKASLVTFAALAVCTFPLVMPFTLANVQHHWWRYRLRLLLFRAL